MARYKYNDKLYDIPEEVVDKFESMYPDAVTRFSVEDDVYEIPVSRKRDFLGTFKNATPYEDFSSLDNPEHDNDFDDTDYVSQSSQNPPPIALRQEFDVTKPDQSEYVNPLTNSPDYNFESLRKKGKIETVKPNDKFGLISESINENRIGLDDEISNAMRGNVPEGIRPIDVTTNLISARNYLNEADDLIKARKEGGGVLRGMRDAASKLGTWDFGTSDLAANKSVYNALRKFERGEELSQDELRLLDAVAVNTAAKVYASDLGVSYDIGSGFVQSIPFMLEMIVNPLSGAGKGVGKALAGYAAKRFGGKVIPKVAGVAGRVVGDIAASTGMAATTGAAGVAADTYSRMIGSPVYTDVGRVSLGQEVRDLDTGEVLRDENGNPVKVGSVGKESIGSALYKSLASRSIDNFSEMFGSYFGPVGDILKETKAGKKISASALVNSMNKLTTADWTKGFNKIMQDAKYDGFFGETAEEYVGGLLNAAIVGDQSLEDLGSLDNLLQTAGTVGLMSGILGSVNLIGLRGVRYNARKGLERSEANGRKVFGDDFDVLKDELMNMDPDKRKDVVRDMIASDRFNMEQKKAIMDYFYRRSVYDGLANGESKKMDEATQAETEAIESESNPETGLYIEASRIDPLTKQLTPGTIVQGMMEDGKDRVMWKGPDGKVEMILKSEIDPSSVRSMQTQEIIDVSVNNIRESMRAEIERDSKYDPSIPSPEETIGQSFYVDGNPYAFFNENGRLNPYLVDLNGKPIKPVRNISVEDYYQAKQAEIDKQKVVQNSPVYKLSDGRIARLIDMDESDVALEILDRDGNPVGNISMTKEDFDNNASMQEQSPYERYVDTGDVDDSVVNLIADKISRGDALTPEEESMRQGASDRVESRLSDIRDQSLKEAETLNVTESISQSSNQGSEVPLDNQEPTGDIKPSVVMKEDGTPNFVSSGVDATLDFLHDKYGEKMPKKIEVTRKAFDEDLKKASEKLDKAQEAYDNAPIGKEDKAEAALIKARQEYEAIKVEADFWDNLDDDIKEASKKPGDVIAKEISVMGDPMSGEELAAMMLANGAIKLTRDTYKKETGAGNNETARMFGLFASPEKGGVNIERAGEILELADKENGTNFFDENDTNAGRDAIIEVLSSARTRGDLIDYVKRNREAIAERERQAEYNAYAEWCEENYHMSPEEYEAYEESMVRDFSEKQLTDEERGELDSQIADEIQAIIDEQNEIDAILAQNKPIENENIEGNDESGGDGLREGGGEVLPREQLDQTGGTGEVEGRESAGPDIDRTDGATQEGSSRGLVPFVAPSPKENETPLDYAERIVEAKRLHEEELKVDTNPTEAQKEAGNYKKGHIKINGFDVTIEQPAGSVRSGKDANGKEWSVTMNNTYGYIRGTESVDGDHIDVFLGPDMNSDMVYVVDQVNTDGSFDEHKVMMGFSSLEDARSAYLSNYEEGWQGLGNITGVALDEFKKWIDSSIRKTKPFSEYKSVVPVSPLTVSRSDKSNEYPLLDIAVDPIVWMKNNPGKTPTSKDLFPAGKADEYLGTIIDEQVVTTDKGITLKYTKYKNGYSITAEKDGGYIKQSYYNNGLPMTSPKFNIGVNDSSFKQYIKKSKDGTLYIDNKDIIPLFVEDVSRKVKKLSLVDKDDYITSAERKHIKAFLESGLKEARVNNSIYEISNIGDDGVYEIVRRFNYTDPLTLVKDENGKLVNKRGEGEHVIRVKPTFEETRPDSGIRFRETRIIPEEENIIKKAKSDGSYMKAPNGNPTNLNEKQWVQVRTKAFKEWFGDWENDPENASKVIDENGEPRVVYHGTDSDFNAFDESHLGEVTDLNATNEDWAKTSHIGFWFNDNKIGFYTKHKPVYLNVRNPLEFASMESLVDEMSYYDSGEDFKRSNSDGYDSVIVLEDEEMGGRSYSVFNDNQIKSATENNEDFSFHNDETSKNEAVKQASEIDGAHFRSIGDKDTDNLNNAETIESSINDWSTKFNTPVKVIHDVDDIIDTDENMLARKRDSKGWYDTSTGEIVIVSPNSTSVGDAQRTFLHEAVGHHGLRELFGDDFDTFLDNVYRNANEDIRKNIIDRTKGNPLNLREATEEYLAELAERGFDNKAERSLWEKIKDAFLDMLRKAGISLDFKLSDNDLRYILWRSYKNLEQGNLMDVAEDTVMRNDLGIGDFSVRFREEEKEDINDLKKKNYRLNKKVDRLKDKIDELHSDSQLSEALKNELINEIQSRIDSKDASNINKEDLLSLLKQVKGAKTKADMEDKMLEVDRISNEIRIRSTQRRIDRLLALKTQDVNGKNMSIAKNVDDSTRRVFDFIRGSLSDIKISGYEQEMKDLRRRNRELTTLIEARGRMTEDTGLSGDDRRLASEDIVSFKKEMEDNKVRISELKNMAEDVRNAKANDLMGELEHMRKELEDKLNEAAEGKAVWSIEDSERKMALDILGISLDARDYEGAVNSINRDIMEKVRNNSSFYAAQMNRIRSMENPTEQKEARKNMKAGYNENKRRIRAEKRLLNETLRSRLEVLDNIESLLNDLVEGGRAALSRKTEEETYRRIDIVRNSIEDVADKPVDINNKDLGKMNWFKKFASSPLGSFDYMAQRVGRKFLNGDGYIYQRFVKGQEGTIAAENELAKNRDRFRKTFANKVNEIFNEDADSVLSDSNKRVEKSGVYIINTDTEGEYGRKIEIPMTKGEAMYVYMVWKMDDGRMKLEQQGFTDDSLLEIEDFIGENYKAFADWIQDDLLVNLRDRYNERYVDMYGTSMANIPNYAPLRINKNAVMNEVDLEEVRKGKKTLEEKANSLIKRTVNSKPIDLSTNGIEAVISHVRDMEEWYAFARVRRDLSWLLSSPTFRNKVNSNVNGHYVDFVDAAALASHSYHPDPDKYADEFFAKVNRGLVGANISFGLMTAAKQILSLPAFLGYSQSPKFMVAFTKNIGLGFTGRPYKWAMENMPMFYERVKDGNLGDEKLRDDGDNLGKIIESYLKIGMVPNKMIDAFTISVGAKSVYDYTYDKLRKGYERLSDDEAKRQALVDAEIFFNQTQQSGVETFLSPMQRSRTIINRMLTTYQNSNIGYVRRVMLSLYDLASLKDWSKLRSNYAERFKAEGMDDDTANQKAQSLLLNGARKQLFHFLLFGWGMNMLWDLGSSGFFGFFAGDDDEDEKYKDIVKFVTTPVKGVPAGNIINNLVDGYDINPVLFLDELQRAYNNIGSSIDDIGMDPLLAMDVLSNGSKLVGFDMERWGNIYLGMEGLIRNQGKEGYLLQDIMFLLNTPKSQRVKVAREMYKNEPFLDYAEKVSRAYRYTPMSNKWEYWVPGTDILTRSKLNKIKRNYVEDNMTSEQKAQDKERKEKEKEIRRIRELSIDKEAMERFVNK